MATNAVPTRADYALIRSGLGATASNLPCPRAPKIACAQAGFATMDSVLTTPRRFPVRRVPFAQREISAIPTNVERVALRMESRDALRLGHPVQLAMTTACAPTTVNSTTDVACTNLVPLKAPFARSTPSVGARGATASRTRLVGERARNPECFAKFAIRMLIVEFPCFVKRIPDKPPVLAFRAVGVLVARPVLPAATVLRASAPLGLVQTRISIAQRVEWAPRVEAVRMGFIALVTLETRELGARTDLASGVPVSKTPFADAVAMPGPVPTDMPVPLLPGNPIPAFTMELLRVVTRAKQTLTVLPGRAWTGLLPSNAGGASPWPGSRVDMTLVSVPESIPIALERRVLARALSPRTTVTQVLHIACPHPKLTNPERPPSGSAPPTPIRLRPAAEHRCVPPRLTFTDTGISCQRTSMMVAMQGFQGCPMAPSLWKWYPLQTTLHSRPRSTRMPPQISPLHSTATKGHHRRRRDTPIHHRHPHRHPRPLPSQTRLFRLRRLPRRRHHPLPHHRVAKRLCAREPIQETSPPVLGGALR